METNGSRPLHVVRVLDSSGDTRLTFDPDDRAAVAEVAARFNALMERNFVAFDVSTQPGRVITEFDPNASEVIVSHQFAGG